MNCEKIRDHIVCQIREHVDIAVLGLSGGADSLLCALLCRDALGKNEVFAYSMPYSEFDHGHFNRNSEAWAQHIGVHHRVIPIKAAADQLNATLARALDGHEPEHLSILNLGNTRARVRMCLLYGAAHHLNQQERKRARVIGTGNLSEDFIGYDTKGGDALADLFPIGDLFKSEVYAMLEFYRDAGLITESMINRKPSAGLWEGQTDEQEIGFTYSEMEPAIRQLIRHGRAKPTTELPEVTRFVWERHMANKHKHEAPPVIKVRNSEGELIS